MTDLRAIERVLGGPQERRKLPPLKRAATGDPATVALADPPVLIEDALATPPEELDPAQLAALAFCLARPSLRDVALMQWGWRNLATG